MKASEEDPPSARKCQLMQDLLESLLKTKDRQLADHLPGGKLWDPSEELKEQSKSCILTNISGESQFAKMKVLQRKAPNVSMAKIEAKKMFDSTNMRDRLLKMTPDELEETINWQLKKEQW